MTRQEYNAILCRQRAAARMREIEHKMRETGLPIVRVYTEGIDYVLDARVVPAQIVADMVADGWLRKGPPLDGRETLVLTEPA